MIPKAEVISDEDIWKAQQGNCYWEDKEKGKAVALVQAAADQKLIDEAVKEIAALALQAVSEEEEFDGDMPCELSHLLTSTEAIEAAMRAAVVLTKQGITERIQQKLKELGL